MSSVYLNTGIAPDVLTRLHDTPLSLAALEEQAEVCRLLLSCGADATIRSKSRNTTPYHLAALHEEILRVFLPFNPDPNPISTVRLRIRRF